MPIGIKVPNQAEKGHADSAPENPNLGLKLIIIILISCFLAGIFMYLLYKFPELNNFLKD